MMERCSNIGYRQCHTRQQNPQRAPRVAYGKCGGRQQCVDGKAGSVGDETTPRRPFQGSQAGSGAAESPKRVATWRFHPERSSSQPKIPTPSRLCSKVRVQRSCQVSPHASLPLRQPSA